MDSASTRQARPKNIDALDSRLRAGLDHSVRSARAQVEFVRSSTTLAALAQVLEATDARDEAIRVAQDALALCEMSAGGQLTDPTAARIAIEVLVRLDKVDEALHAARGLPIDSYANLTVGSALAGFGRYKDARDIVDRLEGATRDAVLAYIHINEENYSAAIPLLRRVLRNAPHDADSAHNLSIAFWGLGSEGKARSAALRATRSAPGREDISLHYLELLLSHGDFRKSYDEVKHLLARGIAPTTRLIVVQARAQLGLDDFAKAERLLLQASELAKEEEDSSALAEVLSNLARLRFEYGKISREVALERLVTLREQFASSNAVVANVARLSIRKHHAVTLRRMSEGIRHQVSEARAAYLDYQLATLEGMNELAAEKATKWLELEPENPFAASAAMTALGIGLERWQDAASIALGILDGKGANDNQLNNIAYILAMAGRATRAVELLEPHADDDFVLKATLGLAYLASGEVERGMKMYRQAADKADSHEVGTRSLMTAYQALVVRQLGLLESSDTEMLNAISLPAVELPEDWADRPEFLRLQTIALKNGYPWPLAI